MHIRNKFIKQQISLSTARRLQKNVKLFTDNRYRSSIKNVSVNIGCIQRQADFVVALEENNTETINEILCL